MLARGVFKGISHRGATARFVSTSKKATVAMYDGNAAAGHMSFLCSDLAVRACS
jgi:hypothetical protein